LTELPRPGVTSTLARFVADTQPEDIPPSVQHEAKRALLNFFAVALAGCRTEPVELALQTLAEFSGGRQATVVGRRERIDALNAAFLNGAGANVFYLNFDNLGALQSVTDGALNVLGAEGDLGIQVGFDVPDALPDAAGAPTRQTFNVRLGTVGDYKQSITQFASRSTTKMIQQDGYTLGYLDSFRIDQSGVIMGVYSNGTNRAVGQIALATFTNPGGLEKAGENNYVVTINSGAANVDTAGVAGKGKIISGALEMSNVDLAEQFTDMIVTQRGFQANSRSITTADQMLQEVLSLKR